MASNYKAPLFCEKRKFKDKLILPNQKGAHPNREPPNPSLLRFSSRASLFFQYSMAAEVVSIILL